MRIGVVSDTHNNTKNIEQIISIFNNEGVEYVIHTGDICNSNALKQFSGLKSNLIGVYGNNDRNEMGLEEIAHQNGFIFLEPPYLIKLANRKIAVFHEPNKIDDFLSQNKKIDIVLHGHTHRYRCEINNDVIFFNPGESAGILKGKNAVGIIDLKSLEARRIFF